MDMLCEVRLFKQKFRLRHGITYCGISIFLPLTLAHTAGTTRNFGVSAEPRKPTSKITIESLGTGFEEHNSLVAQLFWHDNEYRELT